MALIYLAGPIDGVSKEVANDWRQYVGECLATEGHVAYLPNGAFYQPGPGSILTPGNAGGLIESVNRDVIKRANGVIANLSQVRGIGTIREIEAARRQGKPVMVLVMDESPTTFSLWDCMVFQISAGFWTSKEKLATLPILVGSWLEKAHLQAVKEPTPDAM